MSVMSAIAVWLYLIPALALYVEADTKKFDVTLAIVAMIWPVSLLYVILRRGVDK